MGQDTRSIFQYLKDSGYNFLIGGFHVKGQVIDAQGRLGLGLRRPDDGARRLDRTASRRPNPADQLNAWKKQIVLCEHELPGTARHDPLAYLQNRTVDWLDHQLAARELLTLDVANTHLVVEHEYPKARIQDRARLKPILQGSIAFVRAHRRGRGVHVRAAARGAGGAGDSRAGRRPAGVPVVTRPFHGERPFQSLASTSARAARALSWSTTPARIVASATKPSRAVRVARDRRGPNRIPPTGGGRCRRRAGRARRERRRRRPTSTAIGLSGQMHGAVLLDDAGRGAAAVDHLVRSAHGGASAGGSTRRSVRRGCSS